MPFEPHQSWVDCITNIRSRLPALSYSRTDIDSSSALTVEDFDNPGPVGKNLS